VININNLIKMNKSTDDNNINKKMNRHFSKRSLNTFLVNLFCYVILIGVVFLILFPLIGKVTTIFKSYADLIDNTVMYIPKAPSLETLRTTLGVMKYQSTLVNTTLFSFSVAIIEMFVCTYIAYGFARFKFPGRNILFAFVMLALIVPPQVIMTSLYFKFRYFDILGIFQLIFKNPLNLIDTFTPFALLSITGLGIKNSLYIYLMRQYFKNMPSEFEEAGFIDGAGTFQIFFRIMLPNAIPMMVTIFLFAFSWYWTDSYYTSILFKNFTVLSNALSSLQSYGIMTLDPIVRTAIIDTGLILVILPLILVYLVGQKFFIQGLARSGIVG
jgi:multiple sugar transport system permease protein